MQKKIDKSLPINDRIAFLRNCAKFYETNGTSPIDDKSYDIEYAELELLAPDDPFFNEVGGSIDAVQGQAILHKVIMGSLSKSPDVESFDQWLRSQYSPEQLSNISFLLQHKIDGLSLGLLYKDGKLVQALTRGDGITGIDVTEKAKMVSGVPLTIPCKEEVEIRGECYKARKDFYNKWHKSVGGNYMNPRNFTAGAMNEKDPQITKEKELNFIGYEAVRKEFPSEVDKNLFLVDQGFITLNSSIKRTKTGASYEKVVEAVKFFMDSIDRANLEYDIDGIVVKLNDIPMAKKMGYVSGGRKPKANRAVKFPPEEKETIINDVICQVGRTGALTPVAILEPFELGGAIISKVTLHNYGSLVGDNAIKIGARVAIQKRGDIIPQIVKVKSSGITSISIPVKCPACGSPVKWDNNKVDIICDNYNCIGQLSKKLDFWFKTIGVKGFGKETILRLVDEDDLSWEGKPIISSVAEMYYMLDNDRSSEHPFRKYAYLKEQLGEKKYENLLASIKSITEISLPIFIEALGIEGIGSISADICNIAPTVDDIDKLSIDDLRKIDKMGEIKAKNFLEGWKSRRDEINRLLKYIKIKATSKSSNKLEGKKFCFTGSFANPSRSDMEKLVVENGGKISSVSKDLTALVFDGESMKGKYEKAKTLGIPIITQEDFLKML